MVDFSGQVILQADEKNRYRIPAKYRSKFGEGPLHYMRNGNCYLSIISHKDCMAITSKLSKRVTLFEKPETRKIRQVMASIEEIKEDNQGRFTLPIELKQRMGLGKEIVFIGMGRHIELWNKEDWDKQCEEIDPQETFAELCDLTFDDEDDERV